MLAGMTQDGRLEGTLMSDANEDRSRFGRIRLVAKVVPREDL